MKLLTSWKENDYKISVTTPYPFLRTVEVNFVAEGPKLYIIATGEWRKDLKAIPMVKVRDESFIAEEIDEESAKRLFRKKYGQAHIEKYFQGSVTAYALSPGVVKYDPDQVISTSFDESSGLYERNIREDFTQLHMRAVSGEMLKKYYFKGAEILDIGAGVMFETRKYISTSRITAVENSPSFRELILKQFNEQQLKKLVVCSSLNEISATGQEFDIIFSTFGYLELNNMERTIGCVKELLNVNGLFIAGFWNSKGFIDNLLSFIQGDGSYVSCKMEGLVPVGHSRYSLAAFTHKLVDFEKISGVKIQEVSGVCTIIPPYNYRLSQKFSRSKTIRKIDSILGRIRFLATYSDFILVVLKKTEQVS